MPQRYSHGNLNLPMLATVMALSVLTSILVLIIPALRIKHFELSDALKEGAGALASAAAAMTAQRPGGDSGALAVALLAARVYAAKLLEAGTDQPRFYPANKLAVDASLPKASRPKPF